VLSLGPAGALSASAAGLWRARPPDICARSTVGAGDAMVAALAYGLMKSLAASDALRLATAASCAASAVAGPFPPGDRIEALLPQITVTAVAPSAAAGIAPPQVQ